MVSENLVSEKSLGFGFREFNLGEKINGFGFGKFGLGKKVSVLVLENLVSEKKNQNNIININENKKTRTSKQCKSLI